MKRACPTGMKRTWFFLQIDIVQVKSLARPVLQGAFPEFATRSCDSIMGAS
ncbi:MAG: hypothetical protein IPI71_10105 [Methanolinea sp.]|nr:MAG: hypothetical protein IPI71_10105 [Methanolinea sp.]